MNLADPDMTLTLPYSVMQVIVGQLQQGPFYLVAPLLHHINLQLEPQLEAVCRQLEAQKLAAQTVPETAEQPALN